MDEVFNYLEMRSHPRKTATPRKPVDEGISLCSCCGAGFNGDKLKYHPQGVTIEVFTNKEELETFQKCVYPSDHYRELHTVSTKQGPLYIWTQMTKAQSENL